MGAGVPAGRPAGADAATVAVCVTVAAGDDVAVDPDVLAAEAPRPMASRAVTG